MRAPPLAPRHCPLPPLLPPSHPCPSLRAPEPRNRPRALRSRWLSKGNPDPDGFHLKIVAAVARVYMHEDKDRSPLTAAFAAKGLGAPDFALFCALPTPLFPSPRIGGRVRASMCAYLDSSPPPRRGLCVALPAAARGADAGRALQGGPQGVERVVRAREHRLLDADRAATGHPLRRAHRTDLRRVHLRRTCNVFFMVG